MRNITKNLIHPFQVERWTFNDKLTWTSFFFDCNHIFCNTFMYLLNYTFSSFLDKRELFECRWKGFNNIIKFLIKLLNLGINHFLTLSFVSCKKLFREDLTPSFFFLSFSSFLLSSTKIKLILSFFSLYSDSLLSFFLLV